MPSRKLSAAGTHRERQIAAMRCPATVIIRTIVIILYSDPDAQDLEHPRRRTSKDDNGHDDDDQDGRSQGVGIVSGDTRREGYADRSSEASPEEHHLIRVRDLLVPLTSGMEDPIDQLGQREDGSISRGHDGDLSG